MAGINTEMGRIKAAKDPRVKLARQGVLLDRLQRKLPGKWDEKLTGLMNMAMLLNPKSIIRNLGGNQIMAAADIAADALTAGVDRGVSIYTGQRSAKGVNLREYGTGFLAPGGDFLAGYRQARSEGATRRSSFVEGIETMNTLGKLISSEKFDMADLARAHRSVFSSPVARGLENTLNLAMGPPDRASYMARYRASLMSQMRAAEVAAPTAEMVDRAALEASRAIYRDSNFVSTGLRGIRTSLNEISTLGRSKRFGAGQAVVPFVQVPGALLMRGLEFSPVGFLKGMAEMAPVLRGDRPFNQREFSQSFSKALLGTAGLLGTGYALNRLGILTGAPDPDAKARALKREMALTGYQINASALKRAYLTMDWKTPQPLMKGDVLVNYDWAQPLALPLAVGAGYSEQRARNATDVARGKLSNSPNDAMIALLSGARSLEEQPLLSGLSSFVGAAAAANQRGAGTLEALTDSVLTLPGQFVPSVVRQMQQIRDNQVYETRGSDRMEDVYRQTAANIPGLAKALGFPARMTSQGEPAQRYDPGDNTAFNVLVNPAMVRRFKADPQLNELYQLWQATGSAPMPERPPRSITINGAQKTLTAQETSDYTQLVGRLTRDAFGALMRNPGFAGGDDDAKARVLGNVVGAANSTARILLFGDRPTSANQLTRELISHTMSDPRLKGSVKAGP